MDPRIDAFLDDELKEDRLTDFQADLQSDDDLQSEFSRAVAVQTALRNLPTYGCPEYVKQRVMEEVRPVRRERPPLKRGLRVYAPGLATLLIIASLAIGYRSTMVAEQEPTQAEVQQALEDVRLAFALVADVGRTTGQKLRDEALIHHTVEPVRGAVRRIINEELPEHHAQ